MVEPELTEVGELHSLTDWQVSDASEEAELEEFCSRRSHTRGPTHQTKPGATGKHNQNKGRRTRWEGHIWRGRQRQTYTEEGGMREAEGELRLIFHTHRF